MNAFLARGLGGLNAVLAVFIIVAYTLAGMAASQGGLRGLPADADPVLFGVIGAVAGFVIGGIAACLICGIIAVLIGIHKELRLIRQHLASIPIASLIGEASARGAAGSGKRNDPWF